MDGDMKLLELCLSDGVGGLELYAKKLMLHYSDSGRGCLPVVKGGTMLQRELESLGIKYKCLRVIVQYFPLISAIKLARWCNKENITTLHFHWRGDLPLAALTRLFVKRKIKLVYTRQMALTKKKHDIYHRFMYKNLDMFLTITKLLEHDACRYLPLSDEKIRTLYYGVPAANVTDKAVCSRYFEESKIDKDAFTVALFGRIEQGKGQYLLIDAVDRLHNKGIEIVAAIIGHSMSKSYSDSLVERAGSLQSDAIHFLGFHPNPPSIMGCFDVVVLASNAETFGLVLAEAMRAGTAVIGTNAGGVPEIIEDGKTGMLFEPGDEVGLAACIEKLYNDPGHRKQIAAAGKKYADEHFSEQRHYSLLDSYLANN